MFATFYRKQRQVPRNLVDEENVTGKIAIVTGANTGIGKETARALVKRGATVILACRNEEKTRMAIDDIKASLGVPKYRVVNKEGGGTAAALQTVQTPDPNNISTRLVFMKLDLEELASIRSFASEFKARYGSLHILVLNAGVADQRGVLVKSKEGFEYHMGINHLGHFLLTNLLLDVLKASAPARVITVASFTYGLARLDIDDLMMERTRIGLLNILVPYSNSKLANLLFTKELAKRLEGSGVTANAVCPGWVESDLFREQNRFIALGVKIALVANGSSPEEGCQTTLHCALSKKLAGVSGKFYQFGYEWKRVMNKLSDKQARKLWDKSEALVGLSNQQLSISS